MARIAESTVGEFALDWLEGVGGVGVRGPVLAVLPGTPGRGQPSNPGGCHW